MKLLYKLHELREAAQRISERNGKSFLLALMNLLQYRMATGYGADMFLTYRLFEKTKEEWSDFIAKKELCELLMQVNSAPEFRILDNKIDFFLYCYDANIPSPSVVLLVGGDDALQKNQRIPCASDLDVFNNEMKLLPEGQYIAKPRYGSHGIGVLSLESTEGRFRDRKTGVRYSSEELGTLLLKEKQGYLLQETLVPHQGLLEIMPPPACGVLRVVTYLTQEGDVLIPYAYIKVPAGGGVTDHFMLGKTGNLLAGLDVESGKCTGGFGLGADGFLTSVVCHPDTGTVFTDVTVPYWHKVIETARESAKAFKTIRFIGWDIAVTDNGPQVVEGNRMFDPDGLQVTLQRGIRSEIEHMILR